MKKPHSKGSIRFILSIYRKPLIVASGGGGGLVEAPSNGNSRCEDSKYVDGFLNYIFYLRDIVLQRSIVKGYLLECS